MAVGIAHNALFNWGIRSVIMGALPLTSKHFDTVSERSND
jgi:hypothetical protein